MLSQVQSVSEVGNLTVGLSCYVAPDNIFNECFDTILLEGKPVKCCQGYTLVQEEKQTQKKQKFSQLQQQNEDNQVLDEDMIIQFLGSDLEPGNLNTLLNEQQNGNEVVASSMDQLLPIESYPPMPNTQTPPINTTKCPPSTIQPEQMKKKMMKKKRGRKMRVQAWG